MNDRRALPFDPKEIRQRLQRHAPALVHKLGFHGQPDARGRLFPINRLRNDRRAGSFVIWTQGEAAGAFRDYAVSDFAGDIFDLIRLFEGLHAWIDAYWWALNHLNLDRRAVRSADQERLDAERAERDRLAAEARAKAVSDEKSGALLRDWLTLKPIAGTVAEFYLREARRIPLERLKHQPGALRFDPGRDHFDMDTGEVTRWPAMVSIMTRGVKAVGQHVTWLSPDGSAKAPVAKVKKMRGPVRGAAIRLSSGPSGLSPTKAARTDPLAIGEGIETTLSVACARPDYRAWAAGSLSLMGLLDWPACASAVVLLRDNDWKPEALKAFAVVEAHWRAQAEGRPLHVVASAVGSDFNDWARNET